MAVWKLSNLEKNISLRYQNDRIEAVFSDYYFYPKKRMSLKEIQLDFYYSKF